MWYVDLCHRESRDLVHAILGQELAVDVHALTFENKTPGEGINETYLGDI